MKSFFQNNNFSAASAQSAKAVSFCARFALHLDAILVASIFVMLALVLALVLVRVLAILGLLIILALLLRGTSEYNLRAFGQARAY